MKKITRLLLASLLVFTPLVVKSATLSGTWSVIINDARTDATLIGDTGFDEIFGLTFFDDELYGVLYNGTLINIDKTTGAATVTGLGSGFSLRASDFLNSNALNIGGLTTI